MSHIPDFQATRGRVCLSYCMLMHDDILGRSDKLATAAREELLQQRVSAAEDTAARASATAVLLREEAGRLGTANGKLNADCETLRGRLSEAEPALAACQAQLQVSADRVVVSHEAGSRHLRHNKSSSVLCMKFQGMYLVHGSSA